MFRCERCGFITLPMMNSDPRKIRGRRCRWFDPKVPGFQVTDPCWCQGLGDVVGVILDYATRWLPRREAFIRWCSARLDKIEEGLNLREKRKIVADGACEGCTRRRLSLNSRYPLVWLRKRICPPIVHRKEEMEPIPVCFVFPHGFGDAVQFTAVLQHLRKYRPNWRPSIYCKAGAHSLFQGQVEAIGIMDRDNMGKVYQEDYALVHTVRWLEPEATYSDSPSTKVEKCLREEFGITPEPELWDYRVNLSRGDELAAFRALESIAERRDDGRFRVVAIHYQGNSFRESKNLDENVIRELVPVIREAGYVPLILDFEPGYRSSLLQERMRGVKCFGHDHHLWKGLGVGDGSALYSMLRQVALVVGIDSGPEHLAAATDTPTIVIWGRHTHPINYFSPARNVLHVVRKDQHKYIRGDIQTGKRFFDENYRQHVLATNARIAVKDLVATELAKDVRSGHETCGAGRVLDS